MAGLPGPLPARETGHARMTWFLLKTYAVGGFLHFVWPLWMLHLLAESIFMSWVSRNSLYTRRLFPWRGIRRKLAHINPARWTCCQTNYRVHELIDNRLFFDGEPHKDRSQWVDTARTKCKNSVRE